MSSLTTQPPITPRPASISVTVFIAVGSIAETPSYGVSSGTPAARGRRPMSLGLAVNHQALDPATSSIAKRYENPTVTTAPMMEREGHRLRQSNSPGHPAAARLVERIELLEWTRRRLGRDLPPALRLR